MPVGTRTPLIVAKIPPPPLGDSLPIVNLGSYYSVLSVGLGQQFACALLDLGGCVKCWGKNVD